MRSEIPVVQFNCRKLTPEQEAELLAALKQHRSEQFILVPEPPVFIPPTRWTQVIVVSAISAFAVSAITSALACWLLR
jgi:hypothetical protein